MNPQELFPELITHHCRTLYQTTHQITCLPYSSQEMLYLHNRVTDSRKWKSHY